MSTEKKRDEESKSGSAPTGGQTSGDPGRTPDKAEGDEETVEESLRQKEERGRK